MLTLNLKQLIVFHIVVESSSSPSHVKLSPSLKSLRLVSNAFAASTCKRHVYICHQSTLGNVEERRAIGILQNHTKLFEKLEGPEAYQFLLKWALGLLNNKLRNNDQFVRGQLREDWTKFLRERDKSISAPIIPIVDMLFKDATNIRAHMQDKSYDLSGGHKIRNSKVHIICENCSLLRKLKLNPIYARLQDDPNVLTKLATHNQLKVITKKLSQLQMLADKNKTVRLTPSQCTQKETPQFKQFMQLNSAIALSYKSKQIQLSSQTKLK